MVIINRANGYIFHDGLKSRVRTFIRLSLFSWHSTAQQDEMVWIVCIAFYCMVVALFCLLVALFFIRLHNTPKGRRAMDVTLSFILSDILCKHTMNHLAVIKHGTGEDLFVRKLYVSSVRVTQSDHRHHSTCIHCLFTRDWLIQSMTDSL